MNTKEKLIQEIEQTPDIIIEEVLNFILFTKSRYQEKITQDNNHIAQNDLSQNNAQNNLPIWELFEETAENIPDEILQKLPIDGAEQHDHYLYGTAKREE
jgi:hypothetical protein